MTEMVYGTVPVRDVEPILPKWWRTVDTWTLTCILILFGIGMLLGLAASPPLAERNGFDPFHYVQRQAIFGGAALVALSVGGMMVTGWAMLQPSLSAQQYALRYLFDENPSADADALAARRIIDSFSTERELAAYLDSQNLPEGSILVDTVYGFAVVAASSRPDQFVVPSDQDFTTILNDPAAAGVQYLLTVPNSGRGESDAINRRYPSIYDNGALEFSFVFEAPNDGADQPDWRLYEV